MKKFADTKNTTTTKKVTLKVALDQSEDNKSESSCLDELFDDEWNEADYVVNPWTGHKVPKDAVTVPEPKHIVRYVSSGFEFFEIAIICKKLDSEYDDYTTIDIVDMFTGELYAIRHLDKLWEILC